MKCCNDTDCTQRMMRHGFFALKSGEWEDNKNTFRNEVKVAECAFDRIKEALEKVAKDEARKLSTVQEIMIISTDYLRRIIAPAGEQGAVAMSCLCPNCNSFPLEDNLWEGGGKAYEMVVRDLLRNIRLKATKQAKVLTRPRERGPLWLLANQQEDGDGLILCEESRNGLTEGLREFRQIDNHRAQEVGHVREGLGPFKVRRPKGQEGCKKLTVREGPDELRL